MSKAQTGNNVRVHYKGTLEDGTVFDDSRTRGETLNFELGTDHMIQGFQNEIVGMEVGQTKAFKLACDDAYGQPVDDAVVEVPKEAFPENFDFVIGSSVQGTHPSGHQMNAVITEVKDEVVLLDHNHPLSGKDLSFEVELVEIKTLTTEAE